MARFLLELTGLLLLATNVAGHGPGDERCGRDFGGRVPQFHVMDRSCQVNDPNGPFYDPKHGIYHLFYQDHQAESSGGVGKGPVWGHVVSRDLAHWAHLPVAIWNDQWYDEVAVFTGSATVVNGDPILVYPGLCRTTRLECAKTQFTLAVAIPADREDPLLVNWTKPAYNPVLTNSPDDPSGMWQASSGEWRHTGWDGGIYGSRDLKNWTSYGRPAGTPFGPMDCPSLFPLPRPAPGTAASTPGALPTHVHKGSDYHKRVDYVRLGNWTDGAPGPNGSAGFWGPASNASQLIDIGAFYAAKDFYDPVKERRILWGWAKVQPASAQTLPREVAYHPALQQLLFNPIEEVGLLRGAPLGAVNATRLNATGPVARLALGSGAQADVAVAFEVPKVKAIFGAEVLAYPVNQTLEAGVGAGHHASALYLWIDFTPGDAFAEVGASLVRPGNGTRLSGPKARLPLLPTDPEIDVRVLVDSTVVEVFWLGGRVVATVDSAGASVGTQIAIAAWEGSADVSAATAWPMHSAWVNASDLRGAPLAPLRASEPLLV